MHLPVFDLTVAADDYIVIAAWEFLCSLPRATLHWVVVNALYRDIEALKIRIDYVGHPHLPVVASELEDGVSRGAILAKSWHYLNSMLLIDTLAVGGVLFQ